MLLDKLTFPKWIQFKLSKLEAEGDGNCLYYCLAAWMMLNHENKSRSEIEERGVLKTHELSKAAHNRRLKAVDFLREYFQKLPKEKYVVELAKLVPPELSKIPNPTLQRVLDCKLKDKFFADNSDIDAFEAINKVCVISVDIEFMFRLQLVETQLILISLILILSERNDGTHQIKYIKFVTIM